MAKKIPVASWITNTKPNNEPKPQKYEIFAGTGKSISMLFTILKIGWFFKSFIKYLRSISIANGEALLLVLEIYSHSRPPLIQA